MQIMNRIASSRLFARVKKTRRAGFNLVEAAIVLGVVGLVIGGIWIAAAQVRQAQRVSELAQDILFIVRSARNLFPLQNYPAAGAVTNVSSVALNAGVFPSSYKYLSSQASAISSNGTVIRINLGRSGVTPQIRILVYVNGGRESQLTLAECTQLAVRLGGIEKNTVNNLQRVQFNTTGGSGLGISYPPISLATGTCPATTGYLEFWYNP